MQLSPEIKKDKPVFQMVSFLQSFLYFILYILYLGFKSIFKSAKHFSKKEENHHIWLYFARIPCIIDELMKMMKKY